MLKNNILFIMSMFLVSSSAIASDNSEAIFAKDYGKSWAFSFDRAVLVCVPNDAVFIKDVMGDKVYALNGSAIGLVKSGAVDASELTNDAWMEDPEYKAVGMSIRVDVSPFIDAGLKLCR